MSGTLAGEYLRALYTYSPEWATFLGLHEYDGRITDPSAGARAARLSELQRFREQLEQVDVGALEGTERLEHDLIAADLTNRLYELQDLKPYEWK